MLRIVVRSCFPELHWALEEDRLDPACRHWATILERYNREWWYVAAKDDGTELKLADVLKPTTLVCAHTDPIRLPLDGVLSAASLAGLSFATAAALVDDKGRRIELMFGSPAKAKAGFVGSCLSDQCFTRSPVRLSFLCLGGYDPGGGGSKVMSEAPCCREVLEDTRRPRTPTKLTHQCFWKATSKTGRIRLPKT